MKLNEQGELPREYIDRLDGFLLNASTNYNRYRRYVEGDNPAIMDKSAQADPDNRVPVPFARKIVSTLKGYMAKPGYITYKSESIDYQASVKDILDGNDEELLTGELLSDALTSGYGYEILRVEDDEGLKIKQYRIKFSNGYPVYDDTLAENIIAFVHQEKIETASGDTHDVRTIYYKDFFVEYSKEGEDWAETNRQDHPFGDVPVALYKCNMDGLPVFEPVLPMIDEHDKIISSDYANELERFANAYLVALKKITNEVAAKVKEIRIFDDIGDSSDIKNAADAMAFLTKPSRGTDISEAADRFERLIYEMAMVINPNDDAFATASGIALRYKLLPMEWLAADIEGYFSKGLQRRFMLMANAMLALYRITAESITVNYRRNIPIDIDSIVETMGKATGILSRQTVLSLAPADIVPDVEAEMERLDEEQAERMPEMDDDNTTVDDSLDIDNSEQSDVASTGEIQQTALNGAQIKSLVDVVMAVSDGSIPKESAISIVEASFPLLDSSVIQGIFSSVEVNKDKQAQRSQPVIQDDSQGV